MADRHFSLAGVAAGALGGLIAGQYLGRRAPRTADRPPAMPQLETTRRALAETRGEVAGSVLAGRVQARFDALYAARPRFPQPALQQHLERSILPSLALYQTLLEEGADRDEVAAEVDRIFAAWAAHSRERKLLWLLEHGPNPFGVLRWANRLALKGSFPPEGWRIEWQEDSNQVVAFDIHDCFYHNVLTAYGAPELTAHCCRMDDLLYGNLPGIRWERTHTLGRGDPFCNFRFERIE